MEFISFVSKIIKRLKLLKQIKMIFKIFKVISLLIGFNIITNAQPLIIQWQKCLGGTLGESGISIRQTADGGYISGGLAISNDGDVSGNHGNHIDYWVVKLSSNGNLEWQKCYGGSGEDYLYSIQLIPQDGFIMAGVGGSSDGDIIGMHFPGDFWIVKCDSIGTIQWQKCLGGTESDNAHCLIRSYDKGFLAFGFTQSIDFDVVGRHIDSTLCPQCVDSWLVKLDSAGNFLWSRCYGGSYSEIGYSLIQTTDSGYVIASYVNSWDGDVQVPHQWNDYWIVKIDPFGVIQWQKCFGGSLEETPNDLIQTSDGGLIIIGSAVSTDYDVIGHHGPADNSDAWIVKLDYAGNMQWQKCLGGTDDDGGKKIIQLNDGGYLALCSTGSFDGDLIANPPSGLDAWLVRLDQTGNILWQQCLGGSFGDVFNDMQLTPDGGAILIGTTDSNDGDVSGNHGDYDMWVVKLAPLPDNIQPTSNSISDFAIFNDQNNNLHLSYYSNANGETEIQLFDLTGRLLMMDCVITVAGINKQEIPIGILSMGLYITRVQTREGTITKKLLVK